MERLGELWRRLLFLFRKRRFDRELEEEMHFHLEMKQAAAETDEARFAARRRFGNVTLLREESRELWGWSWAERIAQDLLYALRMLRKNSGLSAVAVLVLALGIGGATTVFSVVNAIVLNPFPYPQADRLVDFQVRQKGLPWSGAVRIRDYFDFREQNQVFEEIAVYGWFRANVTELQEPERMIGGRATSGFLRALGVEPALGRFFAPAEDVPDGPPVVALSYGLWQRQFAGRDDVLGRTLTVGGRPHTVIGVMPARLALPGMFTCDFWTPAAFDPAVSRGTWMMEDSMIARLKPGVSLLQAQAAMAVLSQRLQRQYPDTHRESETGVVPIGQEFASEASRFLPAPVAAAGLVLVTACANLAGLMLARSAARAREMATRASLGASRARLIRQMLTESLLLSLAGGAFGLLVARWGVRALIAATPPWAGLDSSLRIDSPVFLFALVVSVLTGVCFGLAPAAYSSRPDLNSLLKSAGAGAASGPRNRLLSGLVVAEIALALVLLTSGALLLKSFIRLLDIDLGVRPERLLTFQLGLPGPKYRTPERRTEFFDGLLERLRAIPGVRSASAVSPLPMSGEYSGGSFQIEGRPSPAHAQYCGASPGYFRAMGVPVLVGREFDERDRGGPPVVIVNHTLAQRYFPGENPLGRRIKGTPIVGVIGDVRHNGPASEFKPQVYSLLAAPWAAYVVVRTTGDPMRLAPTVRGEVRALDRDLPVDKLKSMERVVWDAMAETRILSSILGGFALFALALAALGLYGVIAYSVSQRTHEIGVRVALGASSAEVTALVLRQGALLTAAGVAIGLPAALAASKLVASLLHGVKPHDFPVFAGVSLTLAVVALTAPYLPARRAARVDPLDALRCE